MAQDKDQLPPPTQSVRVGNDEGERQWSVPEEVPVAFVYNRRNYAVMLASPKDLEDFAIGFTLSERIARDRSDINAIDIRQSSRGAELHIDILPERLERLDLLQRRRNMVGRAGCGVCGLENAETFFETLPKVSDEPARLAQDAIVKAAAELADKQTLNQDTRSVHGAAFSNFAGDVACVREDVGRHNALDKLIGACVSAETNLQDGFVTISSRCSYEIVEKSARLGIRAIVSFSGPTAFAIRKAKEANITLYCRERSGYLRVQTEGLEG